MNINKKHTLEQTHTFCNHLPLHFFGSQIYRFDRYLFELSDTKIYILLKKQTIHICNKGLTAGRKLRSFSINNMLCAQKYLVLVHSKKS